MWLYGGSPLLYRDKLYVQVLQREPHGDYAHALDSHPTRDSYLLCIDPKTGKDLWRQPRKTDAVMESMEAYTTPLPLEINKRREVIVAGGDYVTAHNPDTGEELWRCGGLNLRHEQWWRLVSSPVAVEDLVLACGPKRDPVLAIRDGGKGMVTDTNIAWKSKIATPDVCTPLVYQKKLFVLDGDRQTLASLDPKTGEKQWSGKFSVHETFSASPTGADGKIYCISEGGTVVVADAGDEFKILSTIKLHEENCRGSIVASGGQLFVRTGKNLWCVGKK
jgi:outer membrane protein assembly factor BamB